jgi:chemotaxis protein CheD
MALTGPPPIRQADPAAHITVLQGDVRCCAEPTILMTVLGSCVAVCLWDARSGLGGMNHFVLPHAPEEPRISVPASPRYGDVAMADLVNRLLDLGCHPRDLQAKLFGGAAVLVGTRGESVGDCNVRLALDWLLEARIPITARRTGGIVGQQIRFHTGNGEVLVRSLSRAAAGAT